MTIEEQIEQLLQQADDLRKQYDIESGSIFRSIRELEKQERPRPYVFDSGGGDG